MAFSLQGKVVPHRAVKLSLGYKVIWGLAGFGTSIISGVYGALLPIFYQDYLGLAARWIAVALSPFILEGTHFITREQNNGQIFLDQPVSATNGIRVIAGLVPGIAMLLGALILVWYPLRGKKLEKVQQKVLELHAQKHSLLKEQES